MLIPAYYGVGKYGYSIYSDPSYAVQSSFFKLKNEGNWFLAMPIIGMKCKKSALDLNGNYELSIPNPLGLGINYFQHFDDQEMWFIYSPTSVFYRVMTGQVNKINSDKDNKVKIDGRGLSGILTDKKVNLAWTEKRGDFILCDPLYGVIPKLFPNALTTWNAFTKDYDKFDAWNATRWGAQPAWATISGGALTITGGGGVTEYQLGTSTDYTYAVCEFRVKVSAASTAMQFGFRENPYGNNYAVFGLNAAGNVTCYTNNGGAGTSTALGVPPTQTVYNYYRIEWDTAEVRYFVNGVLVATHTTFIPTIPLKAWMMAYHTVQTMTIEYMKVIELTKNFEEYVSQQKLAIDVVKEICSFGNETTDFTFYIDDDFDLHAFIKESVSSGRTLGYRSTTYTGTYDQIKSISFNEEAKDLYNAVIVRGGEKLTVVAAPNWTDQFIGDGTTTSWALGYKAKKPLTAVTVAGAPMTEDTDFTVVYGNDSSVIKFTAAPAGAAAINIRYDYYTPIIYSVRDNVSIANYGVERQYVEQDKTIGSEERAKRMAYALLAYFTDPRTVITIVIPLDPTFSIGQTVMIDAPDRGVNLAEYEIIELQHEVAAGKFDTTMTLASTDINTSGEILKEILQQLKDLKQASNTNQVVTNEEVIEETVEGSETLQWAYRDMAGWVWGLGIPNLIPPPGYPPWDLTIGSVWGVHFWGDRRSALSTWTDV